jgi:hypothetical protein
MQLILHLNEKEKFVVKQVDDTHIMIESSRVGDMKRLIDEVLERNIYDANAVA